MVLTEKAARLALPRPSPYKIPDGRGLYLHVGISGGKHWHYRYRQGGRDTTMSLGTYPYVSLDEARVRRLSAEQAVQLDLDPQALKIIPDQQTPTFRRVGRAWLAHLLRRVRAGRRSIKTFRKSKALLTRTMAARLHVSLCSLLPCCSRDLESCGRPAGRKVTRNRPGGGYPHTG